MKLLNCVNLLLENYRLRGEVRYWRKERAYWADLYFRDQHTRDGEVEKWKEVAEDFEEKWQDERHNRVADALEKLQLKHEIRRHENNFKVLRQLLGKERAERNGKVKA